MDAEEETKETPPHNPPLLTSSPSPSPSPSSSSSSPKIDIQDASQSRALNNSSKNSSNNSRVIDIAKPPSAFHLDIEPPSLVRLQSALRAHVDATSTSRTKTKRNRHGNRHTFSTSSSSFRDECGRFVIGGSSGGFYVGDLFGGLPHGSGQHHIPVTDSKDSHLLYDGQWFHGSKTGSGSIFYVNGEEYEGELRDNQRWGRGWMKYKDGSFYSGDWLRGRRHGIGLRVLENGNCYHGAFFKDSQDGWGTFYWISAGRKFEGEWLRSQPYSGQYSKIDAEDLNLFGKVLLEYCPNLFAQGILDKASAISHPEMVELKLQNPVLTIFDVILALRTTRTDDQKSKVLFKTQVERKENLTAEQLQLLKKVFEVISPMVDNEGKLNVVHIRRMLILARINPDIGQGEKLLAHLKAKAIGKTMIGLDDLLLYILQYHHP